MPTLAEITSQPGWQRAVLAPGSLESSFAGPWGGGQYQFFDTPDGRYATVASDEGYGLSKWFGGAAPDGTPQYTFDTGGNLTDVQGYKAGDGSFLGSVTGFAKDLAPFVLGSLALYGGVGALGNLAGGAAAAGGEAAATTAIETATEGAAYGWEAPAWELNSVGPATASIGAGAAGSVLSDSLAGLKAAGSLAGLATAFGGGSGGSAASGFVPGAAAPITAPADTGSTVILTAPSAPVVQATPAPAATQASPLAPATDTLALWPIALAIGLGIIGAKAWKS